ncbi:MAG: hypothetical protein K2N06_05995 [Oscillospiraceae bacterium]|nr:hypothetical protein [Oscillospiraceae bacterium]
MENKITPELMAKARQAKSVEELLALAKENEIELSENEAKAYFEQLNKSGEISDEELDNVSGGGCHYKDGPLVVTHGNSCDNWACKYCGEAFHWPHTCPAYPEGHNMKGYGCSNCYYMVYEHALLLCNNPARWKR